MMSNSVIGFLAGFGGENPIGLGEEYVFVNIQWFSLYLNNFECVGRVKLYFIVISD